MDLSNPFEVVVYHLLIGRMVGFGHRNKVHMISPLVCMVTYWTKLIVSYDIRLLNSHEFNKLLHCIVYQP